MDELEEIADTMEVFRAATDQLTVQVDALLADECGYDAVERVATRAYHRRVDAEAAAMQVLSGWAHHRLEQAGESMAVPETPSLDTDPDDLLDYVDDTYLAAVDTYFDQIERLEDAGYSAAPLLE